MIMKIIKVLSKKVDNKEYSKYILNLPKDIVEQSNFFGKELKARIENHRIIIDKE
ncbi:MAG: hypothetical protein QT09_C0001G0018 [archaeon GW2011_AR18]|nr:MAG: hypothetical protein QT09_C0001G0018 [archaeon GW2011_AR18]